MKGFRGKHQIGIRLLWMLLILFALTGILKIRFGRVLAPTLTYIVTTRHYGINASEMEQTITNPLENNISELPGILNLTSYTEFAQSRISITLDGTVSPQRFYLLLRDRVERARVYWPDSVQRPQIHSATGTDAGPVFIAVFLASSESVPVLRNDVEKNIKPVIQRIKGVGEVSIGGGGIKEIHVSVDPAKNNNMGLYPDTIGRYIQQQHIRQPLGSISGKNKDIPLLLDGYLPHIHDIERLHIMNANKLAVPLSRVSRVSYQYRNSDDISRFNGQPTVSLYIRLTGNGNVVQTSRLLRKEINVLTGKGYAIETVYDLGEEIEKSIQRVLVSLLISMVSIIVVLLVVFPFPKVIFHFTFSLPLIGLLTAVYLSFSNMDIDQLLLSGMAIGVGLMIDSAIVITEAIQEGVYSFRKTAPPLIVSTLTTLIVFFPLTRSSLMITEFAAIARTITIMLLLSLCYYFVFLPSFIPYNVKPLSPVARKIAHPPSGILEYCVKHPKWPLILSAILVLAGLMSFFLLPKDFGETSHPGILFAKLEMKSGKSITAVDQQSQEILKLLKEKHPGILSTETRSNPGQCQVTLKFDPGQTTYEELASDMRKISAAVPDVFAYVPENDSSGENSVMFTITGGDVETLRNKAEAFVDSAMKLDWVTGGLLHFKENPPVFVFSPDFETMNKMGISVLTIGRILKWSIQGPVALKWHENGEERDLRVFLDRQKIESIEALRALDIQLLNGKRVPAARLGKWEFSDEPSRIFHFNRQRAVSFSLITSEQDLATIIKLSEEFIAQADLPKGYGILIDRSLKEKKEEYTRLWISFLIAVLLIYLIIGIQSESFTRPLVILSIIPVTIAFPLMFFYLMGMSMNPSVIIGLIILSGMSVNNSILISSSLQKEKTPISSHHIILAVSNRYRSLVLTTLTTLLGTLPLVLIPGKTALFSRDMALTLVLGLVVSFLASFTFFPALVAFTASFRTSQE